ncbi:hypothetical protein BpHYR1_007466 [Brachionus plicatilis]|uniref:Uncharacterized protein n=1 Tax=Brachionus plicatilis TaxID=10195 RepID=A0A3M7Q5H6_BRAPC|nr:hypothetical protein BpHYR1_007466 [Brachionus plicatilis]
MQPRLSPGRSLGNADPLDNRVQLISDFALNLISRTTSVDFGSSKFLDHDEFFEKQKTLFFLKPAGACIDQSAENLLIYQGINLVNLKSILFWLCVLFNFTTFYNLLIWMILGHFAMEITTLNKKQSGLVHAFPNGLDYFLINKPCQGLKCFELWFLSD